MLTLKLSTRVLEIPNDAFSTTLSQNLIGSIAVLKAGWLTLENNVKASGGSWLNCHLDEMFYQTSHKKIEPLHKTFMIIIHKKHYSRSLCFFPCSK